MKRFLIYLKRRPLAMASLIVILFLYLFMIFAEFVAPYAPTRSFPTSYHPPNVRFINGGFQAQEYRVINQVAWRYASIRDSYSKIEFFGKGDPYRLWGIIPMERHLFVSTDYPVFFMGSDILGRDLFSRIIYGSRISLTIGFIAAFISLVLAMLFGGIAGYFGEKWDWGIMRISEFFMLIPGLYLILFIRSMFATTMDTGQSFMAITLILSLVGWPGGARLYRGMLHSIKREEFVLNAQLEMINSVVIIFRYCIPHMASLIIVNTVLGIPGFVMTEVALSYLGLGISDPAVSWGSLINRDITTIANLRAYPWLLNPMWFLLALAFAFNFLGDALRDFFDPFHTVFKRKKAKKNPSQTSTTVDSKASNLGSPSLLELRDVCVKFSIFRGNKILVNEAVRGVSFHLKKGEILGIVGESGSGKSVSTHAIPALLPSNAQISGSILYEGKELVGLSINELREFRGKKIGMIFQEAGRSYDPLQSMGNVFFETFKNSDSKITKLAALEKAGALLNEVGITNGKERLVNYPHQFSGGQLQRIGIALALAQGCDLLIADEPTTALDVTIQKQIIDLLKTLRKTRRLSIIFISHDIDLVADISDRMLVMYGGLIMEGASSKTMMTNALHPYSRALFSASPQFGTHYSTERLTVIPGKVTDPSNPEPGCPFAPRCAEVSGMCNKAIPNMVTVGEDHVFRCIKGEK